MGRKKQKKLSDHVYRIFGIADKKHTGKLLAVKHTSFGVVFLLLLLFLPNIGLSKGLLGQQTSSGDVTVNLTATGPPPTSTPVIISPVSGSVFDYRSMLVSGTCEYGYMVKLFNNSQFIGSTPCSNGSQFNLVATLAWGDNNLVARHYDGLDQAGPDSNLVNITINKPPLTQTINVDNSNLYINPNQTGTWQINISGGVPPYTLIINWGDGNIEQKTIDAAGPVSISHSYSAAGNYSVKLSLTDSADQVYLLTFGVFVNGIPTSSGGSSDEPAVDCKNGTAFWSVASSKTCPSSLTFRLIPIYWAATALTGLIWFAHLLSSTGIVAEVILAIIKFIKLITPF